MLLLIDNYDSFTWNLVQLIGTVARQTLPSLEVRVVRNDQITPDEATGSIQKASLAPQERPVAVTCAN